MTDTFAAQFAARQIVAARADLLRDIERVATAARHLHSNAQDGRAALSLAGDLERLIQYSTTALHRAAQLQGAEETAAYLTPTTGDPR